MAKHAYKPAFVLVQGGWHNRESWRPLMSELDGRGHASVAIGLPGAGTDQGPLDPAVLGTEPSAVAGVTHAERTEAVVVAVREAAGKGNGEVIVVGHSGGGATVSAVAERVPDELKAIVFLAAFMLPDGMPIGELMGHELMAGSEVMSLFVADPEVVGALRVDAGSNDPDYIAAMRSALYGDLTDQQFETARSSVHNDESAAMSAEPLNITVERFGTVDRHYIKCTHDRAIPPDAQDLMIRLVDAEMPTTTMVHTMSTSHNAALSDPGGVADVLSSIAD